MSTKIFDVYHVQHLDNCSIDELWKFINSQRELIKKAVFDKSFEELEDYLLGGFDTFYALNIIPQKLDLDQIRKQFHEVWFNKNPSLVVYIDNGKVYIQIFVGCSEIHSMFGKQEGFVSHEYWNNTDGDEDVTEEEWCERGKFWDRMCPSSPCENAIVIELFSEYWMPYHQISDNILKYQKTKKERLKKIAKITIKDRNYKKIMTDKFGDDREKWPSYGDIGFSFSPYIEADRIIITDEEYETEMKKYESLIPDEYTQELYYETFKKIKDKESELKNNV